MAEQLSLTLAERSLGAVRLGERLEASAPFLLGALATGLVAADKGGYFPTSWGWTSLALAWVAGLSLALQAVRASRLELAWVGGLLALAGWTALSLLWTQSTTQSALEVERALVYVLAALAAAALVRSARYQGLLWGVWAGSTAACLYGLATRLLPERLGVTDIVAGQRLEAPVGYWNGLGLLTAIAIVLGVGLTAHGRSLPGRILAAASLPLLLPTLYFTFSRGAWVALAAALLVTLAVSARRIALLATMLAVAVPSAAAVWLAYRAKPLRLADVSLADAEHAGHTLLWRLGLLALAAAAVGAGIELVERRIVFPAGVRRSFAIVVAGAALGACIGGVVQEGGPSKVVSRAHHSLDQAAPPGGGDLSSRLLSLSSTGRFRQWHVALDEWRAHKALGGGAGTFGEYWLSAGPRQGQLLDVHNLYLETLAELGPIGLALLAAALLVPLAAAVRARKSALVPIATGAYVAWLVHVIYDWDWELTGVTLAALLCASAVLAAARPQGRSLPRLPVRLGLGAVTLVVGVVALLGLLGNRALARSAASFEKADFAGAVAAANDARRWAPWSAEPWEQLGAIRIVQGDRAGAVAAYREAAAKDPKNSAPWVKLFALTKGAARRHALARLDALNPGAAAARATKQP